MYETADNLRHSGVGVDLEDNLEEMDISFRSLAEIHGVMGGRAVVHPLALLDTDSP